MKEYEQNLCLFNLNENLMIYSAKLNSSKKNGNNKECVKKEKSYGLADFEFYIFFISGLILLITGKFNNKSKK